MINSEKQPEIERRIAARIPCQRPLMYKVCKDETISKIMEGYTQDISGGGVRCTIPQEVPVGCTLWLKLDKDALGFCEELERKAVILQHGVLGKVAWVAQAQENNFDVGLQFITREERVS